MENILSKLENMDKLKAAFLAIGTIWLLKKLMSHAKKLNVRDKIVLITGATSGLGKETAKQFYSKGARVLLLARTKETLDTIQDWLLVSNPSKPQNVAVFACDCSKSLDLAPLPSFMNEKFGQDFPDVIINCAGSGNWNYITNTSDEDIINAMSAPYLAAFLTTKLFLRQMIRINRGTIVNVNSPACISPWPGSATYAASRAALKSFSDSLFVETYKTKLCVSHLILGEMETEYFQRNNISPESAIPQIAKWLGFKVSIDSAARKIIDVVERQKNALTVTPFWMYWVLAYFPQWIVDLLVVYTLKRKNETI